MIPEPDQLQDPGGCPAVCIRKCQRRLRHAPRGAGIAQESLRLARESLRIGDLDRRAGFDGKRRRFRKVVARRPDQHRFPRRARLDQVLPAQRHEASADERDVTRRVVSKHLAHAVTENGPRLRCGRRVGASPLEADATGLEGTWDFTLTFSIASLLPAGVAGAPSGAGGVGGAPLGTVPGAADPTGIITIFDLANTGSVLALETADLGRAVAGGFDVLGREPGAEARGCSLAADEMLGRAS